MIYLPLTETDARHLAQLRAIPDHQRDDFDNLKLDYLSTREYAQSDFGRMILAKSGNKEPGTVTIKGLPAKFEYVEPDNEFAIGDKFIRLVVYAKSKLPKIIWVGEIRCCKNTLDKLKRYARKGV